MTDQTQTTTEPVLLPCPFCGGAHITKSLTGATEKFLGMSSSDRMCWFARIRCLDCGTEQGRMEDHPLYGPKAPDDYDAAIAAWNTRTTPQPTDYLTGDYPLPGLGAVSWNDLRAILALAAPADGYVLVPVEPELDADMERDLTESDQEAIERGLRTIRAFDAVRDLRSVLSDTMTRQHSGYDWNADSDGMTLRQSEAIKQADRALPAAPTGGRS